MSVKVVEKNRRNEHWFKFFQQISVEISKKFKKNSCLLLNHVWKKNLIPRAQLGIEPRTTRTLSEYHTTRPLSHIDKQPLDAVKTLEILTWFKFLSKKSLPTINFIFFAVRFVNLKIIIKSLRITAGKAHCCEEKVLTMHYYTYQ